jgi:type II secretory pathway pseudopilin PulG
LRLSPHFRHPQSPAHSRENGYVLLAIVVMLALMLIAAAAAAPDIAMEIRRQREEEMIHRGTQYMRAIQHYYKKFGRYPMRIEDLENTNNMRFLRRRYKDPVTGKDFRLLHFGEVQMGALGLGAPGSPAGMMGGAASAAMSGAFGQGQAPSPGIFSQQPGGLSQQPGGLGNSTGPLSGSQPAVGQSTTDSLAGKVFGGGPIIGVASTSHAASIREFNKKNHYNDWFFIYDPSLDRGGLIRGPAQPPLAGTGGSVVGPAANPAPNQNPPGSSVPGLVNPSLQGPGAMIPAQPQDIPVQH